MSSRLATLLDCLGQALCDKGRRALSDADAAVDARLVDIAAHLEPRERVRAIAGLQLWYAAMDAYREARARHG